MGKNSIRLYSILFIIPFMLISVDLNDKMLEIRIKKKETKIKLSRVKKKEESLQKQLLKVQAKIKNYNKNIKALKKEIKSLKQELENLEKRTAKTGFELKRYKLLFLARLKSIYKSRVSARIGFIFTAKTYEDFLRRFFLIRRILRNDIKILNKLSRLHKSFLKLRRSLKNKYSIFKKKENFLKRELVLLKNTRKKEEKILKEIQSRRKILQKRYKALELASRKLKELIKQKKKQKIKLQKEELKIKEVLKGSKPRSLLWPVGDISKVVGTFGNKKDVELNVVYFNAGIDIKAGKGKAVKAAYNGVVLLKRENMKGYGKIVIIEHPGNLTTVYAKLSEIDVRVNQIVKKGETIGRTGDHPLHFEVREQGTSRDPLKWLI